MSVSVSGLARGSAVFLVQEADAHRVRASQDATGPSSPPSMQSSWGFGTSCLQLTVLLLTITILLRLPVVRSIYSSDSQLSPGFCCVVGT